MYVCIYLFTFINIYFIIIIIIIIIIIKLLLELFIGKYFLAKGQLHKVSKNNFTSNSGALPQNDKITNYYTSS